MIARRAFCRALSGGKGPVVIGCVAPRADKGSDASRMRAAMWVAALSGQRLGVVEGWRDIRDGTATLYRSRLDDPEYLETVAHTALDLLRFAPQVASLDCRAAVAVVVDSAAVSAKDANAWSETHVALFDALASGQVCFDVVLADSASHDAHDYEFVVYLPLEGQVLHYRTRGTDTDTGVLLGDRNSSYAARLKKSVDEKLQSIREQTDQYVAKDAKGVAVRELFMTASKEGGTAAVVNLHSKTQTIRIGDAAGIVQNWTDLLTGQRFDAEIVLEPYQVRLLSGQALDRSRRAATPAVD
jgi:hypothetical protein